MANRQTEHINPFGHFANYDIVFSSNFHNMRFGNYKINTYLREICGDSNSTIKTL